MTISPEIGDDVSRPDVIATAAPRHRARKWAKLATASTRARCARSK